MCIKQLLGLVEFEAKKLRGSVRNGTATGATVIAAADHLDTLANDARCEMELQELVASQQYRRQAQLEDRAEA